MNTLHLCHWQNRNHFKLHLNLLGESDSLVIYGSIPIEDMHWVTLNLDHSGVTWYLVKSQCRPNYTDQHEIDNEQWLTLIINHNKTLTWK